jgi:hypothetical protein
MLSNRATRLPNTTTSFNKRKEVCGVRNKKRTAGLSRLRIRLSGRLDNFIRSRLDISVITILRSGHEAAREKEKEKARERERERGTEFCDASSRFYGFPAALRRRADA